MKKIIIVLLAGFILSAFSIPEKITPVALSVKELTGYKLRNNSFDYHDYNLWVVTNEETFNREFEPVHDSVLKPEFGSELVLAAKVETVNYTYQVRFKNIVEEKGNLQVYFSVKKQGNAGESDSPLSMITFPKDHGIKKINFYHDNVLVKTVPVVAVY